MIKKLLLSLVIVTAVGASAVVATRALLSDQVSLTANAFSSGTVDLQINSNKTGGTFGNTVAGFTDTLFPGETKTKFIRLKNNNSDVALSIAAQTVNTGGTISTSDVIVAFTPVNSSDEPTGAKTSKTLADWATPTELGDPDIADGATQRYKMDVTLDEDVNTSGATTSFDFIFTGTQVIPTPSVEPTATPTVEPTITSTLTPVPTL